MTQLFDIQHDVTDPKLKALTIHPRIAWPTLLWFAVTFIIWTASTVAALSNVWPVWLSVLINTFMVFSFFTIIHDSVHRAISTHALLNESLGVISTLFYGPSVVYGLRAFRYLHMQHHLHTNEKTQDPDYWCAGHQPLRLIFSWFTLDLYYVYYYLKRWSTRPKTEKAGLILTLLFNWSLFAGLIYMGYGWMAFWLWLIPGRITVGLLGFTLDYLPHHPHRVTQTDNPYQATSIRIGQEWLLTPLLMYHNYHLMHHLFPLAPFYRYRHIWLQGEALFLGHHPAMVSILSHPISVDEYNARKIKPIMRPPTV